MTGFVVRSRQNTGVTVEFYSKIIGIRSILIKADLDDENRLWKMPAFFRGAAVGLVLRRNPRSSTFICLYG